jgi:Dienelactone hydrolase and related enzymes
MKHNADLKKIGLAFALLCSPAWFGYAPAQGVNPERQGAAAFTGGSKADRKAVSVATGVVDKLIAGQFAQVTSNFDATMKSAMPAPKLQQVWQTLIAQYGKGHRQLWPRVEKLGSYTVVYVPISFSKALLDAKLVLSPSNQVGGFFIEPHKAVAKSEYKEPPYAVADKFKDVPVKVGEGTWTLDGTLSLPKGDGPFPAVILVHGSGPNDRDETLGTNKPFRDLAHGLASQAVAVLRYEKRTKQHGDKLKGAALSSLTIKEESIDDALEAVKLLASDSRIAKDKIFVLGHSLGGLVLPRIASAAPDVAGYIFLAANNEPMQKAVVRQTEYILSNAPADAAAKKQLAELKVQAAKIDALKESDRKSAAIILGAAPAYWIDLKEHDPLTEVKAITRPSLFLQGGRDYQVTADGDFARWRKALDGVENGANLFTFKVYPSLNHLFMSGSGKSIPAEYLDRTGNVEAVVVSDIADWVKAH